MSDAEDTAQAWSIDDPPDTATESAEDPAPQADEQDAGSRGTRSERRAHRDKASRDEQVRAERDELRSERDTLNGRVETMQNAEIMRHAERHLAEPRDLLLVTTPQQRAEVWNNDGTLDQGAMAALIDSALDGRPHWRRKHGSMDMNHRPTGGSGTATTWSELLRS